MVWIQVVFATSIGFLLGYLFIKTKSLVPSIILHYLINTVGQLYTAVNPETYGAYIDLVLFTIIGAGIIPAVLGILLVKLVVKGVPEEINS